MLTEVNGCTGVDMRGMGDAELVAAGVTGSGETGIVRGVSKAIEGAFCCGSGNMGDVVDGGSVGTACGGGEGEAALVFRSSLGLCPLSINVC